MTAWTVTGFCDECFEENVEDWEREPAPSDDRMYCRHCGCSTGHGLIKGEPYEFEDDEEE